MVSLWLKTILFYVPCLRTCPAGAANDQDDLLSTNNRLNFWRHKPPQRLYLSPPRRKWNRRSSFVCLLATLRKNFWTDLHEIFTEGWQWANEQMIKFWWRSGSRIRIATLVRRALAEVCTVPALLVLQMKWTNLQRSGVKFPQDFVHQNDLKSY